MVPQVLLVEICSNTLVQKQAKKLGPYIIYAQFDVSHLPADIEWVNADLRSEEDVEKAMQDVSVVVQAAATTREPKTLLPSRTFMSQIML